MSETIHVVTGFGALSDPQLSTTAATILKGVVGNPAIPASEQVTKAQAALGAFNLTVAAQPHGGVTATAEKKATRRDLIVALQHPGSSHRQRISLASIPSANQTPMPKHRG